jgi:hypothetical protein
MPARRCTSPLPFRLSLVPLPSPILLAFVLQSLFQSFKAMQTYPYPFCASARCPQVRYQPHHRPRREQDRQACTWPLVMMILTLFWLSVRFDFVLALFIRNLCLLRHATSTSLANLHCAHAYVTLAGHHRSRCRSHRARCVASRSLPQVISAAFV